MRTKGFSTSVLLASVAWAGFHAPAMAQDAQAAAEDTSEEIIVTASRREQSLQDTAISVNAVTAEALDNAGITSTDALQTTVPALQYSSGGSGSSFIYMRGVGSNIFGAFSDNSVATYIDGVYIPRSTIATQELFDVERVEVLRGPQATLYGRNATGGAVLINTTAPTDEFEGSVNASFGNYGDQRYRAVISGPLVAGINGRLSVVRHFNDGYNTNLVDGSSYGGQDFWGARGSLATSLFDDNLDLLLTLNYGNEEGSLGTVKQLDPNTRPFLPPPAGLNSPYSTDPRASYHNLDNQHLQETFGGSLRATWDLGFAELVSTTSQQTYDTGPEFYDLDDSTASQLQYEGAVESTDFLYQDVLLRSHGGPARLDWFIGATWVSEETEGVQRSRTPGGLTPVVVDNSMEGYAFYGQVDYHLTDQLTAVAGVRYSSENRQGTAQSGVAPVIANDRTWDDTSPRFALEWRPNNDVMLYASATRGFKSGAFDPQNPANAAEPETIWSYELGARTDVVDWLTFNATLFHYDMTDLQLFSGVIVGPSVRTVLQNAGGAEADGVELEATFHPTENFRFGAFVSLLNARYTDGTILADTANAVTFPIPAVNISDVGGNRMMQAPETSASVFAQYTVPLGNLGSIELYGDYFFQSERYFSAFEDPTLRSDDYDLINARVTFTPPSERWHIAAYVRNAGDSLVESNLSRVRPFGTLASYTPPQLYGIEIGARF